MLVSNKVLSLSLSLWDWVMAHESCGSRVSWWKGHVGHGSQIVSSDADAV